MERIIFICILLSFSQSVGSINQLFGEDSTSDTYGVHCYFNRGFGHDPRSIGNIEEQSLRMNLSGRFNEDIMDAPLAEPLSPREHYQHFDLTTDRYDLIKMLNQTIHRQCVEKIRSTFIVQEGGVPFVGPEWIWLPSSIANVSMFGVGAVYYLSPFLLNTSSKKNWLKNYLDINQDWKVLFSENFDDKEHDHCVQKERFYQCYKGFDTTLLLGIAKDNINVTLLKEDTSFPKWDNGDINYFNFWEWQKN